MATAASVLITDVRLELGNPPTTRISDAQVLTRINYSYLEVATRYRHPEMHTTGTAIATVDGTATYALPTRYWYTRTLRDETNDRRLLYRPLSFIHAQDVDTKGQPQYWTRDGANRRLWPTPDAVYSITDAYVAFPAALTSSSPDASTIFDTTAWDEIVKWGAIWRCHLTLGENNRMIHTRNIWRTLVNSMPEQETMENESESRVIPPLGASPIPFANFGTTE